MAPPGSSPPSEAASDPPSTRRVMPIEEHIQHHMLVGNIPPLHGWLYDTFPMIEDSVLAHIRTVVGHDKMLGATVRIWNLDATWLAIVGVILLENISRDWVALDSDIEAIIRNKLREEDPLLDWGSVTVTYQLLSASTAHRV
ncbi:hypothetical protein PISL3812_07859 [Talaromyces islandicus]|uniref:Uncharacterized protein n=1 Tax=Talaromyces islandicus TaxID=28573 RepID=A0A0U1M5G3_TALIS|nr:hypothetical protein PISL3812_07859 [Talaromyces islandicus]